MAEVTTGDKIVGKIKEGVGKVTGNKDLKEEGQAVHKVIYRLRVVGCLWKWSLCARCDSFYNYGILQVEKDNEKLEKQAEKVAKQDAKVAENAARGGVSDPSNVGVGEKILGSVKEGLGSLTGNKSLEKEGAAVRKTEEASHKADKEADKFADKHDDLEKHRTKAGI